MNLSLIHILVNVEKGDSLADAMEMENKIFPSLLIPVSYTHLDVYKRQVRPL